MKKDTKHSGEYRIIADSSYIVLPDQKVARLLTATVRNGVVYYNLFVTSYTRMALDDSKATIRAGEVTKAPASE